ncbi:MAG: DNA-processing protein DprA [Weeksellaceae bacterium]
MNSSKLEAYLGFSQIVGIGPVTFTQLIAHFGSVEAAYAATEVKLENILRSNILRDFIEFRNNFNPTKLLEKYYQEGITILAREDPRFPQNLREISDAPICLYVKGDLKNFDFQEEQYIAVVGTRRPSPYGEEVARKFATELALQKIVIVSGLALGIDAIAHTATLDVGGKTIAFMGCGVNLIYPRTNQRLYQRIIENGGLVISEFPPDMQTRPGMFISRNRLISGLSRGTLVVEGLEDSGSLVTARYALEQGREVFAPPAPINSELSQAPNLLLKQGAKLVTRVSDILEEFKPVANTDVSSLVHLSQEERSIVKLLKHQAQTADELAISLKTTIYEVLSVLSSLELDGIVVKTREGKYAIF